MRRLGKRFVTTAARLRGFDAPTVWQEFTPLSNKFKSVNLGQGFPDWNAPDFIKEALVKSVRENHNQYCRSAGDSALVNVLAKHYSPLVGRKIDPITEVTISVGATEGLFAIMQSFVNPGDEVILLEPAFDIYPAQVQMAGGVAKYVPLRVSAKEEWYLDVNELERAITPNTKLLLLNTPHNPTGKVFTRDELMQIREVLLRHPHVVAVCDEVYEKLVYDGMKHERLAALPDMWDRVLTVSSCGKSFSVTGWKVGWVYGASVLLKNVILANQWVQYSVSTPTQLALAQVLEDAEKPFEGYSSYYEFANKEYEKKRDRLMVSLTGARLHPIKPQGGYFIIGDSREHTVPEKYMAEKGIDGGPISRDWAFARYLTMEWGVTPIPPSAFYTKEEKHLAANLARFAFCKTDEVLLEADKRLKKFGALSQ